MPITVFLADDHPVLTDALRLLLESQGDLRVIGSAADGRETVRLVTRLCPDVVVMDIVMPEINGIEATRQIRQTCPNTQIVILSMYSSTEHLYRALQAGARGYVLKESVGTEVMAAVRAAHSGSQYLSKNLPPDTVVSVLCQVHASPLERLSAREHRVLQLVAEGHSSAAIATELSLSVKTVETYRSRLMAKLGVEDLSALIRFAIEHGLTPL